MALILNRESNPTKSDLADAPLVKFVSLILARAIWDKVDLVIFELDQQLHAKGEIEHEQLLSKAGAKITLDDFMKAFEMIPKAFAITFKTGENKHKLAPAAGSLFDPAVRIILNAGEIPYWRKGEISGEFETEKPASKWRIESKDLTRSLELKRVFSN
jgi:hypothetical protein